jgi:hypothetical protein
MQFQSPTPIQLQTEASGQWLDFLMKNESQWFNNAFNLSSAQGKSVLDIFLRG